MCRQMTLYVYVSPLAGGRWYNCRFCHFSGDSIELYQAGHGLKTPQDAVVELDRGNLLNVQTELSHAVVRSYVSYYIARRRKFTDFLERAQKQAIDVHRAWLEIMQQNHIWQAYSPTEWHQELGRFVGGATKKDLEALALEVNIPQGFSHFIVCPFYDVPGRLASLYLLGRRQNLRVNLQEREAEREDGLMMLDANELHDDIVIALDDPIIALQMQRKNFADDSVPLKLVVYGQHTIKAWQSLSARRIIFWNEEQGVDLFMQARKHPRAYIARRPQSTNIYDLMQWKSLPVLLKAFRDSSVPWLEALKDFILEKPNDEVLETVRRLELTAYEMSRMLEICTADERARVQAILGDKPPDRYVHIAKMRVVEADGAWWIIRKNQRELGCNAVIRIDKAKHAKDSSTNIYEGTVIANGKTVRFNDDMEDVEKKPLDWLRKKMMEGGLGVPVVQNSLKSHLITIAKQFHEPVYVQGFSRVGWYSEEQAFIFPNFSIMDGRITDSAYAMSTLHSRIPAAHVYPLSYSEGDWDEALKKTPENAALWAGLASVMSNIVAPVVGVEPQMVGFVGGMGSTARVIGQHIASELGLVDINTNRTLTGRNASSWRDVVKATDKHSYPVWVEIDPSNVQFYRRMSAADRYNAVLQLPESAATALAVGEAWVFVIAKGIMAQRQALPKLHGAMRYLAWLQGRGFQLPSATNLQHSVLQSLAEWADEELNALSLDVFSDAEKLLWTADAGGLERRLMWLIFWLRESQQLSIEQDLFYDTFEQSASIASLKQPWRKKILGVVDIEKRKVYVYAATLKRALANHPSPCLDEAIQALAADAARTGFEPGGDGFLVDLDYWNAEAKRWHASKGQP